MGRDCDNETELDEVKLLQNANVVLRHLVIESSASTDLRKIRPLTRKLRCNPQHSWNLTRFREIKNLRKIALDNRLDISTIPLLTASERLPRNAQAINCGCLMRSCSPQPEGRSGINTTRPASDS